METRKTILVLTGFYLPGFKAGGPIRSVAGLVAGLKGDFDFKIICGDRDLGDSRPFESEPVGRWYDYHSAKVLRLQPGSKGIAMLFRVLRQGHYDVVYLNGVWLRRFSMAPLWFRRLGLLPERPVVLAPRGEFTTGALGIKPGRKRWYLRLARSFGLFNNVLWQASSEYEKRDILAVLGQAKVAKAASISEPTEEPLNNGRRQSTNSILVAPDLTVTPPNWDTGSNHFSKVPGELRVVTLGRVCRMKNIEFAISLFRNIAGRVIYDIYGPLEDTEYLARCRSRCAENPDYISIRFLGPIPHESVLATLSNYQVFLLPTLGENFGHVVLEAMTAGCVPIISDRTPWRNLQAANAGWDLPLAKPECFTAALREAIAWSGQEHERFSRNAKQFGAENGSRATAIHENRLLFGTAMTQEL